jgi:hypothetical protein
MLKLGCDPELFLADAAGGLISAIGLIGGTKTSPAPLPLGDGYAVQEDNVAVEFNTPPASDAEVFSTQIGNTIAFLEDSINERYGLKFSSLSAALFPEEQLSNPAALEFGCDPDYNVWTGKQNPRPSAPDKRLRSCGGHVHIGYPFLNKEQADRAIKLVDLFLGVGSVLVDEHGDMRRPLYGKGGAMRYKPYGVEYRTLSNFWVFNDKYRQWIFKNTEKAMSLLDTSFDIDSQGALIQEAINNNNKALAMQLVSQHNISLP